MRSFPDRFVGGSWIKEKVWFKEAGFVSAMYAVTMLNNIFSAKGDKYL